MDTLYTVYLRKIPGTKNDYEQVIEINESFRMLPNDKIERIYDLIEKTSLEIEQIKNEVEVNSYVN